MTLPDGSTIIPPFGLRFFETYGVCTECMAFARLERSQRWGLAPTFWLKNTSLETSGTQVLDPMKKIWGPGQGTLSQA